MVEHDRTPPVGRTGGRRLGITEREYREMDAGERWPKWEAFHRICKLCGWPQTFVAVLWRTLFRGTGACFQPTGGVRYLASGPLGTVGDRLPFQLPRADGEQRPMDPESHCDSAWQIRHYAAENVR